MKKTDSTQINTDKKDATDKKDCRGKPGNDTKNNLRKSADKKSVRSRENPRSSAVNVANKAFNKILLKIIIILVLAFALVCAGFFAFKKFSKITTEKRVMQAKYELQKSVEMTTVKSRYSDIISIKKTRIAGLAKSFSIVKYDGILRAGIADLSDTDIKVSSGGKKVGIILPECEILGNDISDIEVFDEDRSIFVSVSMKEVVDEVNLSRKSSAEKLVQSGILDDAHEQAVLIVENIFKAAGFSDVEVH